jgi:nitrogen fixation protein NifU and related proteins
MELTHSDHVDEVQSVIPPGSRFWSHARQPRNLGDCREATSSAIGIGSCGDKIKVDLVVKNNIIEEVKCTPDGCLYTVACASAMSVLAAGNSIDQALKLQPEDVVTELEGLPEDHLHCARLAVNTLGNAISEFYRRTMAAERERPDEPAVKPGKE